jgi:hypothetical protein
MVNGPACSSQCHQLRYGIERFTIKSNWFRAPIMNGPEYSSTRAMIEIVQLVDRGPGQQAGSEMAKSTDRCAHWFSSGWMTRSCCCCSLISNLRDAAALR